MIETFSSVLSEQFSNDFFTGGMALGAIGAGAAGVMRLSRYAFMLLRRRYVGSLVVDNRSRAFDWFVQWLDAHPYSRRCRRLSVVDSWDDDRPALLFTPAEGLHVCWHDQRLLWIRREFDKEASRGSTGALERFTVSCLGRDRSSLTNIMDEAVERFAKTKGDRLRFYIWETDTERWIQLQSRHKRPLSSVILADDVDEAVLSDARSFLLSRDWYLSKGIPWRRGYLLYGPPGTGKTSLITAVASELQLGISLVNLSSPGLMDAQLTRMMMEAPDDCILLIEDVDAVFTERMTVSEHVGITFSGLLNAIDGAMAQEGRLLFMTTNHLERLDPALIRPGRVDLHFEVSLASAEQVRRMFLRFFPAENDLADRFTRNLDGASLSPATLQAHLLQYRNDPRGAVSRALDMTFDHGRSSHFPLVHPSAVNESKTRSSGRKDVAPENRITQMISSAPDLPLHR